MDALHTPHAAQRDLQCASGRSIETFPAGRRVWKLDAYTPAQGTVHSWQSAAWGAAAAAAAALGAAGVAVAAAAGRLRVAPRGRDGESCTRACAAAGKVCNLEGLEAVGSQAVLMGVVMQITDSTEMAAARALSSRMVPRSTCCE